MIGPSAAAQALGLPGLGDLTTEEAKRRQREMQQNPPDRSAVGVLNTFGPAVQALLGTK